MVVYWIAGKMQPIYLLTSTALFFTPLFNLTFIWNPPIITCFRDVSPPYSIQDYIMDALFMWYHHLWFPPTMVSPQAIWFSLPLLFSIFPASYLWKWQCYLQPLYPWICRCGGSTVVEIISGLAMDCGEWSGERAYSFICETSSSVVVENSLTSWWKWAGAAGCTGTPSDWEGRKNGRNWEDRREREEEDDLQWC